MKLITNNVPRPIINGFELTEKEKQEFDYMEGDELDMNSFFRYRGEIYTLSDFVRIVPANKNGHPFAFCDHENLFRGWDGIKNDSFFSAIVIRLSDCGEAVTVGLFLS